MRVLVSGRRVTLRLDAIEVAKETSMKKVSSMETTTAALGIDLGDRFSHWCALNAAGEVVDRGRVRTSAEAIGQQAAAWRGARVALENGTHSGWVSRALTAAGCQVTVANPPRWRGTAHASKKTATTPKPWPAWCASILNCCSPSNTAANSISKTWP
jgi:hypothetical protein